MRSNSQAVFHFVKSKTLSTQYPTFLMGDIEDGLLSTLHFVENLLPDRVIMICERSDTPRVSYVSKNCHKVLGYNSRVMQRMPLPEFLELIHPDDVQGVYQCYKFINELEPYDPLLYRFEMYYRIRHKDGNYIHICNEKMTIRNNDGKYIYLACFRNVSEEEKFNSVKLNIYQYILGDFKKVSTYNPRQNTGSFTPRQKDIIDLIRKGFSNQEIANRLHVSINTVKNHKNLLFRKLNIRSSIELAGMANELDRV